ncbi:MAG: tetratricopeptide repeat protein [Desulfurivibrionaceae bacterium]
MFRLLVLLTYLLCAASVQAAGVNTPKKPADPFFGEALYYAYQEEWFAAIARLDTELGQFYELDEPELDSLFLHLGEAEFDVGDFELAYRMHHRGGRAIKAVIEGNVGEEVRNEAIFRLARIFFQKEQPGNALRTVERISGAVPEKIRDDLAFLRAQILMANGDFPGAAAILSELRDGEGLEGFASYNLGIALIRSGRITEGRRYLDLTGRIVSDEPATLAIRDKANLVLGYKLMEEDDFAGAKEVFDRVRLSGPFSNRALLGSGWADVSRGDFEKSLVPWSILIEREITDPAVQEGMLAVPYAYGKLDMFSNAAIMYGEALESFNSEIDKLGASIKSIREGKFLRALVREEVKQDADWVVRLRELPETPETYYLLNLMSSHSFQESLKNYLDLEELRRKLEVWDRDLNAFEEIIALREAYYTPLLPEIDHKFRQLDSKMRLRLEQRDHIESRLRAMLVAPRPDYLATMNERLFGERIVRLEQIMATRETGEPGQLTERLGRLRGVLDWNIYSQYDQRFTEAHESLRDLNRVADLLPAQYFSFVRTRQGAVQSYQGYDDAIRRLRIRIKAAKGEVRELMARQGHMLEVMALNELTERRTRLEEFQVKARFAMADSYDRATGAQGRKGEGQ